ncbi:hypothetical protein BASA81_016586 [Batrachochytrium salamandrivorans]|nr:hypothetical protein BASA81_016586 [Batrachochytrium salamandrivorans]
MGLAMTQQEAVVRWFGWCVHYTCSSALVLHNTLCAQLRLSSSTSSAGTGPAMAKRLEYLAKMPINPRSILIPLQSPFVYVVLSRSFDYYQPQIHGSSLAFSVYLQLGLLPASMVSHWPTPPSQFIFWKLLLSFTRYRLSP